MKPLPPVILIRLGEAERVHWESLALLADECPPSMKELLMAFSLPVFNITCAIWHPPGVPPALPDVTTACQLYFTSRGQFDVFAGDSTLYSPPVYLRVPIGTDLFAGDLVEVEPASGIFYTCRWVERIHLGFANEYRVGILEQLTVPGPPPGQVLLEDGTDLLLEDGTLVLLE